VEDEEEGIKVKKKGNKFGDAHGKKEDEDNIFGVDDSNKGDEFMAVKPWMGAIKEPNNFK